MSLPVVQEVFETNSSYIFQNLLTPDLLWIALDEKQSPHFNKIQYYRDEMGIAL